MNAVQRLWRGIARDDSDAIAAQLHARAVIEWPHSGERLSATEYVVRQRLAGEREVHVHEVIVEEERIALRATVDGRPVAGFYELQQSRIATGVEFFV